MGKPLTVNQITFCEILLTQEKTNATEAYLQSYQHVKIKRVATAGASRLLRRVNIQNYLAKRKREMLEELNIVPYTVLREDKCLAFADIRKLFTKEGTLISPSDLPEEIAKCIVSLEVTERYEAENKVITYKYKLADKGKALERLGKYLKLYTDKVEHGINLQEIFDMMPPELVPVIKRMLKMEG